MWSWKQVREWDPGSVGAVMLITVFSAAYLSLGWHNFRHFMTGVDLAGYAQALFNLSHGRLPFNTFKEFVMWGDHAHFIITLLAPLYRLWPDARLLLAVQALAATTAGWPLYKVAQRIAGQRIFALAILYAYLAFVGLQYALDFDFHPSVLTAAATVWMFYGIYCHKPWVYWLAFALGLATREDAAPIFFMIGVWWLLERPLRGARFALLGDRWRVGVLTMIFSAAYFLLIAYLVMPLWSPNGAALLYLDGDSKDLWSLVRGFFFYPDAIVQNMFDTEQKIQTISTLFASFSLLPLLSPVTYLAAAPIFYSRFASSQDYRWLLTNHSNANILPILAVGTILAAGHLRWLLRRFHGVRYERAAIVAGSISLLFAVHVTAWTDPKIPLRRLVEDTFVYPTPGASARSQAFKRARALIPAEAPVAASSGFLAHLAGRQRLYTYPDGVDKAEWVVVMSEHGNPWPLNRDQSAAHIIRLQRDAAYTLVFEEAGIFVFQKHR